MLYTTTNNDDNVNDNHMNKNDNMLLIRGRGLPARRRRPA